MWNWFVRELVVVVGGLAMLVAGGYWQGRMIGRWQPLSSAAAIDLSALPEEMSAWSATGDLELDPEQLQLAGVDHYLARNYEHEESGQVVSVLILSGPGGPISVHPPDVCFAGRGYRAESVVTPVRVTTSENGEEHRFAMTIFQGPESKDGHRVQLFWAWSKGGAWSTPSNPRLAFARFPRLYKLYVSRFLAPNQGRQDVDDCLEFMERLLPQLQRMLTDTSADPDAADRAPLTIGKTTSQNDSGSRTDDKLGRHGQTQDVVSGRHAGHVIPLTGRDGVIRR